MITLGNMRQIGLRTLAPLLFVASLLAEVPTSSVTFAKGFGSLVCHCERSGNGC